MNCPNLLYSGDLNNKHLNNELLLIRYSDVRYLNGSGIQTTIRVPVQYSNGVPNTGQNLVGYSNGI